MTDTASIPSDLGAALPEAVAERRLHHFIRTGSTNDVALTLARRGAPAWTLVVADEQTAGRGRRGHAWHSPPHAGLYLSVLLPPAVDQRGQPSTFVTLMAGVALVETLRGLGAHAAGLKWPNDIVCAERGVSSGPPTWRKLGGILAEGLVRDGTLAGIVLGVGVNLLEWPVPPGLCQQVTWLAREADRRVERGSLVALVEQHLRRGFSALAERGGEDRLIEWWSRYAVGLRGAPVAISDGRTGLTAGIDATGALLVDDPDGARHRIAAGPVTWLDSDPS